MKELIDLLEKKVKDNELHITDVDTNGRFVSIGIDAIIEKEQLGRILGILELQARQNNSNCTFSLKPNNHEIEYSRTRKIRYSRGQKSEYSRRWISVFSGGRFSPFLGCAIPIFFNN